jgi:hypothetical protein
MEISGDKDGMSLTEIPLSTPSLLFPALSLLMLAYTNRFLGLATLVRKLQADWAASQEPVLLAQIQSLRRRIHIIKHMQSLGVLSLMLCVVSMNSLFFSWQLLGQLTFGLSLMFMFASLTLCLMEIQMSGRALDLQLRNVEGKGESDALNLG